MGVFEAMRTHPRLGKAGSWIMATSDSQWDFSTTGRHSALATTRDSSKAWRVLMARHVDAYRINRDKPFDRYIPEPKRLSGMLGVASEKGSRIQLSADHPTIVHRYPSINDNARTMIAAALPDVGVLYSKGYVHGLRHPSKPDVSRILALLGFVNSYVCDWWVRRFVDRHVTRPVVDNLPLPSWGDDQIRQAAALAEELLVRGGTSAIPGGHGLHSHAEYSALSENELLVAVETLVAHGFGLGTREMHAVLADFSEKGCPSGLRHRLLEATR